METTKKRTLKNLVIQDVKMVPLKIKYDIHTLNMVLAFIYKPSVLRTRKSLTNINKLFSSLDDKCYDDNAELYDRVWVIRNSLAARFNDNFENDYYMQVYCRDLIDYDEHKGMIIDSIESLKISHEESKYLIRKIEDALQFGYTVTLKDVMSEILNSIDDDSNRQYKAVQEDLYSIANTIINIKRSSSSLGSDQTFTLDKDQMEIVVEDAVQRLQDRNRIFVTGIKRLNTLLSPGYLSKRLYTYLAFPGKGKSTVLLKSALDIRKYNAGVKPKDPDKRPAVLFLTLENDIPETIERIYNMSVDSDDIRNYTPKRLLKKMREEAGLKLTDENNIDIIIKEYKNRELDTNDLYTIIQDLADEGIEVITLIVDYMKRIRPFEKADNEKTELKNITNELKELGKFFDIPVITAQQLNRSGATVVDAAMQAKKDDVTRLVGRDAIAGAWEILENSDFTCIINPEVKQDTGELYLIFKMLKRRYRSTETEEKLRRLDYFAHPFAPGNEICLVDDFYEHKSRSLESLSTQFVAVEDKTKKNAVEREMKDDKKEEKKGSRSKYVPVISDEDDEFAVFDEESAIQF